MKIVLAVAVAILLFLLVVVGEFGYNWITACRGEEKAVFEEFPQYSPRTPEDLDPKPDNLDALSAAGSACFVVYRTPDGAQEVTDYFEERLEENGWKRSPGTGGPLTVRRGNYEYRLSFPGNLPGDPDSARGTQVQVILRDL